MTTVKVKDPLASLKRYLFLAVQTNCMEPELKYDTEEIKMVRDELTQRLFHKRHDELTARQLEYAIDYCNNHRKYPSAQMLKTFRYYSLQMAIVYCDLKGLVKIDRHGNELSGETLRSHIMSLWEKRQYQDSATISHLYKNWINPKCHKLLVDRGEYKRESNPQSINFERLPRETVQYLTTYFMQMAKQTNKVKIIQNPNLN